MSWDTIEKHIRNLSEFDDVEGKNKIVEAIAALRVGDLTDSEKQWIWKISRDRVLKAEEPLNNKLVGKSEIIRVMLAATIAQVPLVLLGPPGTAKSEIVRMLCAYLGLQAEPKKITDYDAKLKTLMAGDGKNGKIKLPADMRIGQRRLFEYLVTRFTTPEEILGPTNIQAMLEYSLFYREAGGMLPNTQIAFLDEIFKANSAILNSLLSIVNEKIYYNGGQAFDADLLMVFGASNECPDSSDLGALYDRFPIRIVSELVRPELTGNLLDRAWKDDYKKAVGENEKIIQGASVNDFRLLAKVNYTYTGDDRAFERLDGANRSHVFDFSTEFWHLFTHLRDEFGISDRTPARLYRVAKALALLDGPPLLEPRHLSVFKYVAPSVESGRILNDVVKSIIDDI